MSGTTVPSSIEINSSVTTNGVSVIRGDIWSAPASSVLIHACNCQGSWNSGIAAQFKKDYPNAYRIYHDHCKTNSAGFLLGTALIIPPQENDSRKHYIACLFTSEHYGKRVDPPADILRYTKLGLKDLVDQYDDLRISTKGNEGARVGGLHSCMINSVRFGVPWSDTLAVMEEELGDVEGGVVVYEFEGVDPKVHGSSANGSGNFGGKSQQKEDANTSGRRHVGDYDQNQNQTQTQASHFQIQSDEFQRLLLQEFRAYDAHTREQQRTRSSSSSSSVKSIDINNLPYTSPTVLPLRKSPHQFRTIVRDGPMGTPEGVDERYVVIAKRSFRGAGPWRMRGDVIMVHERRDVEDNGEQQRRMSAQGVNDEEMTDTDVDARNSEEDEDGDEEEDGEEDEDGEVEIMWDTDGFKYQLMRAPPNEFGEIRRETHWVNTQYFSS